MRYYDLYKHLLGVPYDDGDKDCYGLARRFYQDNYELELPNYARSADFFSDGVDLIDVFLREEDFRVVDVALDRLQIGDGLLLAVPVRQLPRGTINHIGVFVGNGTFIHHMYGKPSSEDYLTPQWSARIMAVVRHPDLARKTAEMSANSTRTLESVLPDHVKRRLPAVAADVLDPAGGEVRSSA